ncbi:ABC transporter permease [Planosporangium flavigriseum]|uniref:ABC transporter n=1 Tax=Planosporangium flavigriseum TaxID=373681 RepID=A0A8J3LMF4_9ACTN|nr:ABC transporter permease [Planosporangium flavigriseum]NJC66542.1 ABC transporter permease [Planosporangium flavigriseum]GIG73415.1 ABC transporter [Planosporangium flavigriseum]
MTEPGNAVAEAGGTPPHTTTAPADARPPRPGKARGGWWGGDASEPVRRNLGLVGVLVLLYLIGVFSRPDIFASGARLWSNELTVLTQAASIGVITIGMTFVMISGGIDLSVGALLALASVWSTTVATQSYGPGVMIFTALAVGTVAGAVNGILIAYGRMVPFIATMALMVAARGLSQKISGKLTQISKVDTINKIAETKVLGIPLLVIIFGAVAAAGWILLNRTTFGRRTVAIGGNPEAARLAGINLRRHQVLLYALSGLCCGIAAIMVTSLSNAGSSDHGNLYELQAIAAAIIGGTSLAGGRGTIVGSVLGVLVFTQITNLFIVNNLQLEFQLIAQGAIIVGAVLIQQFRVAALRRPAPPGA